MNASISYYFNPRCTDVTSDAANDAANDDANDAAYDAVNDAANDVLSRHTAMNAVVGNGAHVNQLLIIIICCISQEFGIESLCDHTN